jgi:DNA-directed RNA polymerase specialized sigma24 family protein
MPEVQDERQDLERGAIAQQELQRLLEAIQKMPQRRRRVVTLVKVYQYSVEETAKRLGIEESTVMTHLLRARKECAEQLQAEKVPEAIHLLGRLFKQIGLGKSRRSSRRRKIIDSKE